MSLAYTYCEDSAALVDASEVIAQLRVELGGTRLISSAGEEAPLGNDERALGLHVCNATAQVTRRWPSGARDVRELALTALPTEARVRVLALVLSELGRADAAEPAPSAAPTPTQIEPSRYADSLSAPAFGPRSFATARPPAERPLSQHITFSARSFAAPVAAAFGPRIALDVSDWEVAIESASASTQRAATEIVSGLAAASLGYRVFQRGADVRADITPDLALGATWFHTTPSAVGASTSATDVGNAAQPGSRRTAAWAAATLRAGVNVAVTPPIYVRFEIFAGYALGLRARVNEVTQLTTRGSFGGIAIGVGWRR